MRQYLADKFFYSTFKINGNNTTGTGFFYIYDFGGISKIFLVTNRHVIRDSQNGTIEFHSSKTPYPDKVLDVGKKVTVSINALQWLNLWKFHPDQNVDVAVFDFTEWERQLGIENKNIFYRYIHNEILIDENDYPDISNIEQIVFVGYPLGLIDNQNLLPIARHGFTASPIKYDFNGKKEFLIDAAVFPGSSGSPVCILNEGVPFVDRNGTMRIDATRFIFLGILTEVKGQAEITDPKIIKHYLNLGVVIKGICINETIIHHFTIRP